MKKLQTLTASSAIALASVGGTAFAQEATVPATVDKPAVNEPALVAKSQVKPLEKSEVPAPSTVKPALDAQKDVVKEADAKIDTAKADVNAKEATVTSTEKEVATATQAVKDAEVTASQATPEKVAEVKNAQAKNLEAQIANQEATEATNVQIKAETKVLAEKQSDVATAKGNLEQAEKDVQTAEQAVANAESALDGTGLANAEKDLKDAQKGVKDAESTVSEAETAFATAKKADEARKDAIKSAETDVNTKNDAVKLAKEKLTTANEHAETVDAKLQIAQDELTKTQDALKNVDSEHLNINLSPQLKEIYQAYLNNDMSILKKYDLDTNNRHHALYNAIVSSRNLKIAKDRLKVLTSTPEIIKNNKTEIDYLTSILEHDKRFGESDFTLNISEDNTAIDVNNLTEKQKIEINKFAAKVITEIRKAVGVDTPEVLATSYTIKAANEQANKYLSRGKTIYEWVFKPAEQQSGGHISHRYGIDNLSTTGAGYAPKTMAELKQHVFNTLIGFTFDDENSNWGHAEQLLYYGSNHGVAFATINSHLHVIHFMQDSNPYSRNLNHRPDPNNPVPEEILNPIVYENINTNRLQEALDKAQTNKNQATTASENAKKALTKASTDYASALSLKTEAEKVLADAMATPLQAQVAENNLRLANIALENAKKRETQASEAVANFSASLADKKATLEKAQDALKSAKTVQTIASQALDIASANLEDQETKLDNLNKQVTKLLAEKDALVKEAKELAETLQAYLDAPVALTKAKQARTAVSVKLELAKSDLETAQSKLENLLTAQKAEEAKLAELEATYAKLVDLAEKAQENVVATLPDGTVIAVPKVAPTAENLPELNLDALVKEDAKDSIVKQLTDGTIVAVPKDAPVAETLPELNLKELAKEDAKEDAKDSTVKTLPDGTIVAVPKDAPVAEELPTVNVDELKKALDAGKEVTLDAQGNVVVRETKPATYEKPVNVDRPQANNEKSNKDYASDKNVTIDNKGNVITKGQTYTSQQQVSDKPTYSRVERAKTLPNTGTKESNLTLFVLAILSGLGIALKRRQGK